MKKKTYLPAVLLFWLLLWQAASVLIRNSILFVGPADVAAALFIQVRTIEFWKTLAFSLGRISGGFLSAMLLGILLGALASRFLLLRELLAPVVLLFKSIPVASFVILALIWIGSKNLSVFVSFMVVLPILYTATLTGLEQTDPKLLEMCRVFCVPFWGRIRAVYLPSLMPYLTSSADSALGLAVKSGVAAEVIGVPDFSIGSRLYTAKIYLSTADLFAWTLVIILAAWFLEHLLRLLLRAADPAAPAPARRFPGDRAGEQSEERKEEHR